VSVGGQWAVDCRHWDVSFCLLTFYCLLSTAYSPLSTAAPAFTSSSSGRFVVMGPDSAQNVKVTRWAEEEVSHVEDLLRLSIPVTRARPVEIRLPKPGLTQEGLVRIVVTRIVEGRRQEAGLPQAEHEIPEWFTVGLAGNLDKAMLSRHRKVLAGSNRQSGMKSVSEVIGWQQVPEGWHGRQAQCGLVTAWVLSHPGSLEKILNRLAAHESVSPEWVSRIVVGVESVGAMEARWRAWCERQDRIIQDFGGLSVDLIRQLKEALPLTGSGTLSIRPEEAISLRQDHPEVMALVPFKIQQIRAFTAGKAPELVEAGERYCRFYEGLVRGSWGFVLRRHLSSATTALDKLEHLTRAREAYLDEIEKEFAKSSWTAGDPDRIRSVLDKSRMESYLDEAEKRFDKP